MTLENIVLTPDLKDQVHFVSAVPNRLTEKKKRKEKKHTKNESRIFWLENRMSGCTKVYL